MGVAKHIITPRLSLSSTQPFPVPSVIPYIFVLCPHARQEAHQETISLCWLRKEGRHLDLECHKALPSPTPLWSPSSPPPPSASQEAPFVIKAMSDMSCMLPLIVLTSLIKLWGLLETGLKVAFHYLNDQFIQSWLKFAFKYWNQWSVCHWNWLYSSDFSFLS